MKKYCITLLAFFLVFSLHAQESMTLQECIRIGLDQNYAVRIIRNTQEISDNNVTAANAGYLPSLGLSAGYTGRLENTRTTPVTGDVETDNGVYNQTANVGLALNWTLFDGFRVQTNWDRLKELQVLGELNTRITIEDFIANITAEYYNYVQQQIRLRNFNDAMKLSKERLRIVELRRGVGNNSGLDWLQARVDFNADSSRYMTQQELVYTSRIRLNEMMASHDVNAKLIIRDTLISVNGQLLWNELEVRTLQTNVSLLASDRNTVLAELDLKTLQARNYPYLTMNTGYGYTWNRYGSGTTKQRGVLGLNAGVTLGVTIFDGNRRREQRNARIQIENAQLRREQLENSLLANLANFWQAYRNNLQLLQLEEENLVAARQNHQVAMERYRLGDLAGIEMREAQQNLLDAEERLLVARYNTKLCEISLVQISGNVLTYLE